MEIKPEYEGIGIQNEKSLHSDIKKWYSIQGDRFEVKVGNFIIDIVRDDLFIEIQTKNFSAIGNKLRKLVVTNKVVLVHPIAETKWIITKKAQGKEIRRKSPKKGTIYDVFDELIRIPDLINCDNFSIELLLVTEEEIRKDDGKGSYRRKGISIEDRKLIQVIDKIELQNKLDFLMFLPWELGGIFTNKDLAIIAKISLVKARKTTYCLRKMDILIVDSKKGNELLFQINPIFAQGI